MAMAAVRFFSCLNPHVVSLVRPSFNQKLVPLNIFQQYFTKSFGTLRLDQEKRRLVVKWNDSEKLDEYPLVWLRDNCQCPICFDSSARSRTVDLSTFSLNLKPVKAEVISEGIQVLWEDNHQSTYGLEWLKLRSFCPEKQKIWSDYNHPAYKTWNFAAFNSIERLKFFDVMSSDESLLKWLLIMEVYGVSLLENVPDNLGQVAKLADRIAFIRKTHYGEDFSVQTKAGATNVAYTSGFLQLHTDLPYYEYKPGINLLHCIVQYDGEGGDSLLADGFRIAEWLRTNEPKIYKILTEIDIAWTDVAQENGRDYHKIHKAPVICESRSGAICRINFSQPQRDSHLPIPVDQVDDWYAALKRFHNLALDHENIVEFKLNPGQMIAFNNLRVLHGRRGFEVGLKGSRHVQGAYIDWDEARSRMRVLKAKLNPVEDLNR